MRLSNLADYAVVTMCAAARHCGSARVSAAELAEETGLPAPTVQKLVSLLSRAGLLRATRGSGGGLQLARPAAAITLADIVEAVEGPIALTSCVEQGRHDCALEGSCNVRPHWTIVNDALRGALANVPLTQLSSPFASSEVEKQVRERVSTSLDTNGVLL
ncbi:MAG: SUF system Fe-S cluster assembly regulator [Sphingomonadales bacterium 32-68-7]|nr:MAG: SUF system Fe-S cluster assembly regulator [Sphingomonadales bacterium 12-68-11]OYX08852.1 MAG: SUF system Fe-S cluster assembly regulator [Sphingomonadales bacterium 32-68-7]